MSIIERIYTYWKEGWINRAIIVSIILLAAVSLFFGSYYYWDRYIHKSTISPFEIELTKIENLVRKNPNDPAVRVALVQYYYANNMFSEAKNQAEQILKFFPQYESALYFAGMTNIQLGEFDNAVKPLTQFINYRKTKQVSLTDRYLETALYYLGVSYIQLGEPQQAIAPLQEALKLNRMDADSMYQLGLAYAMENQHQDAIEQFSNAVRFVPDFSEVYIAMITSFTAINQNELADYARGMVYFCEQDYESAITRLEIAAVGLENFNPVFLGLGLTHEKLGDLEKAQNYLIRALQIDPDDYAASKALNRIQNNLTTQD